MRHNTARKIEYTESLEDQSPPHSTYLKGIAEQAEQACHLSGNKRGCDFEAFMVKYGMQNTWSFE